MSTISVIVLLGRKQFLRNLLLKFYEYSMGNKKHFEDLESEEEFGYILLPENGVPCDNIWDNRKFKNENEKKLTNILDVSDIIYSVIK